MGKTGDGTNVWVKKPVQGWRCIDPLGECVSANFVMEKMDVETFGTNPSEMRKNFGTDLGQVKRTTLHRQSCGAGKRSRILVEILEKMEEIFGTFS